MLLIIIILTISTNIPGQIPRIVCLILILGSGVNIMLNKSYTNTLKVFVSTASTQRLSQQFGGARNVQHKPKTERQSELC